MPSLFVRGSRAWPHQHAVPTAAYVVPAVPTVAPATAPALMPEAPQTAVAQIEVVSKTHSLSVSEELDDASDADASKESVPSSSTVRISPLAHDASHDASHGASHGASHVDSHVTSNKHARFHVSGFADKASRLGNSVMRLTEGTLPGWLMWIMIAQGVLLLLLVWFLMQQQRTINIAVKALLRAP